MSARLLTCVLGWFAASSTAHSFTNIGTATAGIGQENSHRLAAMVASQLAEPQSAYPDAICPLGGCIHFASSLDEMVEQLEEAQRQLDNLDKEEKPDKRKRKKKKKVEDSRDDEKDKKSAKAKKQFSEVSANGTYPLFNQNHYWNTDLYSSESWASSNDAVESAKLGKSVPRYKLTCLATVYAMIERARGNSSYRVGKKTYTDESGAIRPAGVSGDNPVENNLQQLIRDKLEQGDPVIVQLKVPNYHFGHFVLVTRQNSDGKFVANDPLSGATITIDNNDMTAGGNGWRVISYRTVKM